MARDPRVEAAAAAVVPREAREDLHLATACLMEEREAREAVVLLEVRDPRVEDHQPQ